MFDFNVLCCRCMKQLHFFKNRTLHLEYSLLFINSIGLIIRTTNVQHFSPKMRISTVNADLCGWIWEKSLHKTSNMPWQLIEGFLPDTWTVQDLPPLTVDDWVPPCLCSTATVYFSVTFHRCRQSLSHSLLESLQQKHIQGSCISSRALWKLYVFTTRYCFVHLVHRHIGRARSTEQASLSQLDPHRWTPPHSRRQLPRLSEERTPQRSSADQTVPEISASVRTNKLTY